MKGANIRRMTMECDEKRLRIEDRSHHKVVNL
jgi:hypothetical protein